MNSSDDRDEERDLEPELSGYQPHDGRPLRSARLLRTMRVVVILGVIGLVLPGMVTTASVANRTAQGACAVLVAEFDRDATGAAARWQFFGPSAMGWECYAEGSFGGEHHVASLGLIPKALR